MASPDQARWIVMGWVRGAPQPLAAAPTYERAHTYMVLAMSRGVNAKVVPNPAAVCKALEIEGPGSGMVHAQLWQMVLDEQVKWGNP